MLRTIYGSLQNQRWFMPIDSVRKRIYYWRRFGRYQKAIQQKLFQDSDPAVLFGPFEGMRYFNETVWGPITPRWIGSYESEIHAWIWRAFQTNYEVLIDVGCAEGYYAVGMARSMPKLSVYAFDVDPISRRQVRKLAHLNSVADRVHLREWFDGDQMRKYHKPNRTLLVCDVEGAEWFILDPQNIPELREADILVELHPWAFPNGDLDVEKLKARFQETHAVEQIAVSTEYGGVFEMPKSVNASSKEWADWRHENRRGGQSWLFFRVKK